MDVREKARNDKRLIDADEMAVNESEAYMSAQMKIDSPVTLGINSVVHRKIQQLIADPPTIDAVPVVRCEDCKYCNISLVLPTGRKMYNCMEGTHDHQMLLNPNDFCNRGERRKENAY